MGMNVSRTSRSVVVGGRRVERTGRGDVVDGHEIRHAGLLGGTPAGLLVRLGCRPDGEWSDIATRGEREKPHSNALTRESKVDALCVEWLGE
jgi:hypothetical protein